MKKVIIIAASIIFSIFAVYQVIINILLLQGKLLPESFKWSEIESLAMIIIFLLVILVSAAAIFKYLPAKASQIWLIAVSLLSPIITFFPFRLVFLLFIDGINVIQWHEYFLFTVLSLGSLAVLITAVVNIRQALKSAEIKNVKTGMNKTILIILGLACAVMADIYLIDYLSKLLIIKRIEQIKLDCAKNPGCHTFAFDRLNNERSIRILRKLLSDRNKDIRFNTLAVLGSPGIHDKESAPQIRKLINDKDAGIRGLAIQLLGEFDDKESIPEIKKLLIDKETQVVYYAAEALRKLGVSDAEIEQAKQK